MPRQLTYLLTLALPLAQLHTATVQQAKLQQLQRDGARQQGKPPKAGGKLIVGALSLTALGGLAIWVIAKKPSNPSQGASTSPTGGKSNAKETAELTPTQVMDIWQAALSENNDEKNDATASQEAQLWHQLAAWAQGEDHFQDETLDYTPWAADSPQRNLRMHSYLFRVLENEVGYEEIAYDLKERYQPFQDAIKALLAAPSGQTSKKTAQQALATYLECIREHLPELQESLEDDSEEEEDEHMQENKAKAILALLLHARKLGQAYAPEGLSKEEVLAIWKQASVLEREYEAYPPEEEKEIWSLLASWLKSQIEAESAGLPWPQSSRQSVSNDVKRCQLRTHRYLFTVFEEEAQEHAKAFQASYQTFYTAAQAFLAGEQAKEAAYQQLIQYEKALWGASNNHLQSEEELLLDRFITALHQHVRRLKYSCGLAR